MMAADCLGGGFCCFMELNYVQNTWNRIMRWYRSLDMIG